MNEWKTVWRRRTHPCADIKLFSSSLQEKKSQENCFRFMLKIVQLRWVSVMGVTCWSCPEIWLCDWVVFSPPATWVQLHRLAPAACSDSAHLAVGLVDTIFALVEELELLVLTMPVYHWPWLSIFWSFVLGMGEGIYPSLKCLSSHTFKSLPLFLP